MSVVRLSSGRFALLDSYTPDVATRGRRLELTELFPNAKLYGVARHAARFPHSPWQATRTDRAALPQRCVIRNLSSYWWNRFQVMLAHGFESRLCKCANDDARCSCLRLVQRVCKRKARDVICAGASGQLYVMSGSAGHACTHLRRATIQEATP